MAVLNGKDGAVYISNSSVRGNLTGSSSGGAGVPGKRGFMHKILNLTNWSLSQPGPELIDATVFGNDWKQDKIGIRDGGTLTFGGYFDWADSTGQRFLSSKWNQGVAITYPPRSSATVPSTVVGHNGLQSSDHAGYRFELWPSNDTGTAGAKVGMWRFSTGAGSTAIGSRNLLIQSLNVGQDKSGLGTMDMTMKISDGFFAFTTDLAST